MSRTFRYLKRADLAKYDALGFDLDHAFAQYKNEALFKLTYGLFAKRLSSVLPHISEEAKKYLNTEIPPKSREFDLVHCKGWVFDEQNKCYVWLEVQDDSTAHVRMLMKGLRQVTRDEDEIAKTYPSQKFGMIRRLLTQKQIESSWHPTTNPSHHVIENNFEYGYFAAHLKLMDLFYSNELGSEVEFNSLRKYCNESINWMFSEPSEYFDQYKTHASDFLQSATEYATYLKSLNKPLFLLTNSGPDYATNIGNTILGPEWYQTFDFLIFKGKKPTFFTGSNEFQTMNRQSLMPISNTKDIRCRGSLINDGYYLMGNPKPVNALLRQITRQNSPKVLYFGDSVVSDITSNCWDACFIETDVEYPSWAEELVPKRENRLIDYTSLRKEAFRIRSLHDLAVDEKQQNSDET